MASSIFQKLIKNHSVTPIISNLHNQILTPLPILTHLSTNNPPNSPTPNSIPFVSQLPKTHDPNPSQFLNFYPTFSFGDFLNPISATGFVQSEAEVVSDDANTIWADSVKKKRKKKMNKHKMRKLRKHLRRKT